MSETTACAECHIPLSADDPQIDTGDGVFCQNCYDQIRRGIEQAIAAQGNDINWPLAIIGGLAGGLGGALVWWGFTVLTNIAFGLVAIVIGIGVGKGIVMLTGKRARALQILSVSIATLSFAFASYLVTRTFVMDAYPDMVLPLIPDPGLFMDIVVAGGDFMDVVFLAIVIWEAWRVPAPLSLA